MRVKRSKRWWRQLRGALPFLLLALVILVLFRAIPIIENVRLSFTNSRGYGEFDLVGFENYLRAFTDAKFLTAIGNSLLLVLITPFAVTFALVIAIFLTERPLWWKFFRISLFLPAIISPVVLGTYFGKVFQFEGVLNSMLSAIGLGSLRMDWLGDQRTALISLLVVIVWAGLGIGVLIFLAGLGAIDQELYDAAKVDGANWVRQQLVVTIPSLKQTIIFYTVITVIGSFTATFPYVYVLTRGGPGYSTFVAEFAIYESAFTQGQFGYAAAQGTLLFLFIGTILLLVSQLTKKAQS